jgi:hypothetical protein
MSALSVCVLIPHMSACPWTLSPAARVRAFCAPPLWVGLARLLVPLFLLGNFGEVMRFPSSAYARTICEPPRLRAYMKPSCVSRPSSAPPQPGSV